MPVTVAVPPARVTVPVTMRGDVTAVLAQVDVVPQLLTVATLAASARVPAAAGSATVILVVAAPGPSFVCVVPLGFSMPAYAALSVPARLPST